MVFERLAKTFVFGLFFCVSVHADIIFESRDDFEAGPLVSAYSNLVGVGTQVRYDSEIADAGRSFTGIGAHRGIEAQITDTLGSTRPLSVPQLYPSCSVSPECRYDLGQLPETPPPKIAADGGNSSLSLCLSALLSLGACRSIRAAKKLPLGFPPQWYHNDGPFQIGHSISVDLEAVFPVPACCLVQPAPRVTDLALQRHFGTIVSLWRKSQFTPDLLAARGPPVSS